MFNQESAADIAKYIDHTLLRPDATEKEVVRLCEEAKRYGFAAVCVNPVHTLLVAEELRDSQVMTCAVISFPLGADQTIVKSFAAKQARAEGADEIDVVVNLAAVKAGDWKRVESDVRAVVEAAKPAAVKLILECCLLSNEEKVQVCLAGKRAGVAFVKTSTGFAKGGATAEDVALMRQTVGKGVGVKAAGGIRSYTDAVKMIKAGADRIGASAGVHIVSGA